MRAVISLGGSLVSGAVEKDALEDYRDVLEELSGDAEKLVVVTGAGDLKRYIDAAGGHGVSESVKDMIGIDATRVHARTVAGVMGANARIPGNPEEVSEMASYRDLIVLGGFVPGQSTDAVAAQCAEVINAERLVIATSVDGVYDKDPEEDDGAERFESLGYGDLLELVRDQDTSAGHHSSLVDILAVKLMQRSGIEAVVLDGSNLESLGNSLDTEPPGTVIRRGT